MQMDVKYFCSVIALYVLSRLVLCVAYCITSSLIKYRPSDAYDNMNNTGSQPVSRPMEQVHYFGGWVEQLSPFGAKYLHADKDTGLAVGTKLHKTCQTNRHTDR